MTARSMLTTLTCFCILGLAGLASAAKMSIREYPDHVVLEVDGSKDPNTAAKTPAAAPATTTRQKVSVAPAVPVAGAAPATPVAEVAPAPPVAEVAPAPPVAENSEPVGFQAPAGASPMVASDGYQARLQARQASRVADRLKARQDRWSRYLRNKGLTKQQQ